MSKRSNANNRSNQLNPNNSAYWSSRGRGGRPAGWQKQSDGEGAKPNQQHSDKPPKKS